MSQSPTVLHRIGLALSPVLAISAAVAWLLGRTNFAGPSACAALLCLALVSRSFPRLRPWSFTLWILTGVLIGLVFPSWFIRVGRFEFTLKLPSSVVGEHNSGFTFLSKSLTISVGDFEFTKLITPILMLIMFGMGTTLTIEDFARVFKMPVAVGVGLLCQFTIMPLLGYAIANSFGFPDKEIAAGVILVGVAPSGLASNVISYLARANVALSVTITAVASLLAPILTPNLMEFLARSSVKTSPKDMMLEISQMVLVPVLAGLAFHYLPRRFRGWIEPLLPAISTVGIFAMTILTVARGRDNLLHVGHLLILACLCHNLGGYLLGYCGSRALGMDRLTSRTVAIEVGMQNCGLATGLAAGLGKVATLGLAPIIFGPMMNITASILANHWRNHPVKN